MEEVFYGSRERSKAGTDGPISASLLSIPPEPECGAGPKTNIKKSLRRILEEGGMDSRRFDKGLSSGVEFAVVETILEPQVEDEFRLRLCGRDQGSHGEKAKG